MPKATGFYHCSHAEASAGAPCEVPCKLNIGDANTAEALSYTGSYTRAEACIIAYDAKDLGALSTISTGYLLL